MYAVAINGSPKARGFTKTLLEQVLCPLKNSGWKTEIVQLGGRGMVECDGCAKCLERSDGLCVVKDEFNAIYGRMLRANAVILGSPAGFNAGLVPEVNNFFNRSAYLATINKAALGGKVGAAVITVPHSNFIEARDRAHRFFLRLKMIVPGVSGWSTDAKSLHKYKRVSDQETLGELQTLGEMVDWLGRAVQPHLQALPEEKVEFNPLQENEEIFVRPFGRNKALTSGRPSFPMLPPGSYSALLGR